MSARQTFLPCSLGNAHASKRGKAGRGEGEGVGANVALAHIENIVLETQTSHCCFLVLIKF